MTSSPTRGGLDLRAAEAVVALGPMARRDVALGPMTTYRVGGAAAVFARPTSVDDLQCIAEVAARHDLPVLVVGRGSNMLVADDGFDGIALTLSALADEHTVEGTVVTAGSAMALPLLARRLVADSLTGFEWAVGVPGSVGGAVKMNAGGHGSDVRACLLDVAMFDLRTHRHGRVDAGLLGLRFRSSDIADHQIVLDARLQLVIGDRAASESEIDEVVRWRREHQPGGQNAGSVFVNPIPGQLAAGEVIERAGLRGTVLGTASVSVKHANFIQSSERGTAADVLALIELVRARVEESTGFVLRSEVRLVGFGDRDGLLDANPGVVW